jgi:hypothetical protein
MLFLGQGLWTRQPDTLEIVTAVNSSQDDIRRSIVQLISAGIAPYLVKTGQAGTFQVSFNSDTPAPQVRDRWNNWTFKIGGNGYFSGDNNYRQKSLAANAYAGRITDASKAEFSIYTSRDLNSYAITENNEKRYLVTRNDYTEIEQSYVKTISGRWSWAAESEYRRSTYNNTEYDLEAGAGIEYNLFPYRSSNTKFLALRYMVSLSHRNYIHETIYKKQRETLAAHDIGVYVAVTQPWGNVTSGITWYNYLHDVTKNNLSVNMNIQLQLVRGFSLDLFGYGSLNNDQLSVSGAGATTEEVLLRLRALSNSFNYYTGIGISYRFGSKLNNYVNPRFTNGRN